MSRSMRKQEYIGKNQIHTKLRRNWTRHQTVQEVWLLETKARIHYRKDSPARNSKFDVTEDEAAGSTSPSSRQSPSLSSPSSLSPVPLLERLNGGRTTHSGNSERPSPRSQYAFVVYILFAGFFSLSFFFFCFWVKQIWSVTLSSLSYITRQQNC